jgi:excisionase family DNA binding protein
MQERWLSVDEIAAHLGVNPDTFCKCISRKKLPTRKLGRLSKFLCSEVDQWVKAGRAAKDPLLLPLLHLLGNFPRRIGPATASTLQTPSPDN